jgi:hypothetical protein
MGRRKDGCNGRMKDRLRERQMDGRSNFKKRFAELQTHRQISGTRVWIAFPNFILTFSHSLTALAAIHLLLCSVRPGVGNRKEREKCIIWTRSFPSLAPIKTLHSSIRLYSENNSRIHKPILIKFYVGEFNETRSSDINLHLDWIILKRYKKICVFLSKFRM